MKAALSLLHPRYQRSDAGPLGGPAEPWHVSLPDFFAPRFAERLNAALERCRFERIVSEYGAVDQCEEASGSLRALRRLFASADFTEWIRRATGYAGPLRNDSFQIKRFGRSDFLVPHTDAPERFRRALTLSYNLTRGWRPSDGGELRLGTREEDGSVRWKASVPPAFNSLTVFRLDPRYVHAVDPVAADMSRVSVITWFCAPR